MKNFSYLKLTENPGYIAKFFVTGGTAGCHNDNLCCNQHDQWQLSIFSVYLSRNNAHRADSRLAPSQWEMLQSNVTSHWLGANLESALAHMSQIRLFHSKSYQMQTIFKFQHLFGYKPLPEPMVTYSQLTTGPKAQHFSDVWIKIQGSTCTNLQI